MGFIFYLVILALPFIAGAIIIWLLSTKLIKSRIIKILIVIGILIGVWVILSNIKYERPDDLCKEMTEISDNQSLVGLSKEEVEQVLGKPKYEFNDETRNLYAYYAGTLDKGSFLGNTTILFDCAYGCELRIVFDESDKVEYTSVELIP